MNKKAKMYLENITNGEKDFLEDVDAVLLHFRAEKAKIVAEASIYKDEKKYSLPKIDELKKTARQQLRTAEARFRATIQKSREGLKEELSAAINQPIPAGFAERLAFYRQSGMVPSRTEVEALLDLGQKSPLAVAAVRKLLDDLEAPIRLECRTIKQYEQDLQSLDQLAAMPLVHSGTDVHPELVEVLKGEPRPTRTAGGWRDIGERWTDGVSLLLNGAAVGQHLKQIEKNADAWSADITYSLAERAAQADAEAARKVAELTGDEYQPQPDPPSSTSIADRETNGEALARELGKQSADAVAALRAGHYVR
ncbi:MAG: hypothetical protein IJ664_04630 [Clostridia bacterium]|nr:hypothetical protein [Clostridia bacterium]